MRTPVTLPPWSRVTAWVTSPVTQTDALQVAKSVVAAVLAWVVTRDVLGLEQAFLAPWVALLTVHATVRRSVWRGAETVLAVSVGVVLALAVVQLLGTASWALAPALLVGLLLARLPWVRDEGVTIATTALFVITTGSETSDQAALATLPDRLLATVVGVAVALLVNAVVLPPLDDRSAREQVDAVDRRLGRLLVDIADQLRRPWADQDEDDWIARTRSIDADLDHAWSLVRHSQDSRVWNLRGRRHPETAPDAYPAVLERLEDGVSQVRSIARHLRGASRDATEWDDTFRDRYVDLLARVGRGVADPDADVADARVDLRSLVADLSRSDLPALMWPLYGALIADLQAIVEVVDDVASARPIRP